MNGPYWIGLRFYNARWEWVESGLAANFTYWEEGFPIDYLEPRPCALIKFSRGGDGRWENSICDITKRILCEKTLQSTTEKTMTSKQTIQDNDCAPPWVKLLDSCYLFHSSQSGMAFDWEDSRRFCHEQKGYLIEVNTKEEQDALRGEGTFANQASKDQYDQYFQLHTMHCIIYFQLNSAITQACLLFTQPSGWD